MQNEVGHDQYGIFFSLFNFCYLFQIVTDLGLSNYNNTLVAKESTSVKENLSKILGLKLVLSAAFIFIIFLSAIIIDYPESYYHLLYVITANQILVSFIIFLRTNLSGLGHYKLDSILSALDKLILILILGFLLWIYKSSDHQFTITWFVYAQLVSFILTLIVVAGFVSRKVTLDSFLPAIDFSLLKKSLPFALIILTMTAHSRIDGVMLERLLDDNGHEAGIYAASYRFLDVLNIVGFLFAGLLLPIFSRLLGAKDNFIPTLKLSAQLLIAIAISVAIYFTFFGEGMLTTLYPDFANNYYADILTILSWGFLWVATTHIFGTLLTANESLNKMNVLFIGGLILNVTLNWIYIPNHKALAAAYITFITEGVVAVGLVFLVINELKIKIDLIPMFKLLAFGIIMVGLYYLLSASLDLSWILALFIGGIVSFVVSLLLNIIDIREIKEVLSTT